MPRLLDLTCPLDPDYPGNKGLVAAWVAVPELAAGLTLFDLTNTGRGNPQHGVLTNGPTWVAGLNGLSALQFDGANDYVNCGSPVGLNGATAATISAWLYRSSTGTTVGLGGCGGAATQGDNRFSLVWWTDGNLYFSAAQTSFGGYSYAAVSGTGWRHVTLVYDGSQSSSATRAKLFVDGLPQSVTFVGAVGTALGSVSPFWLGADASDRVTGGIICGASLHLRPLPDAEIRDLYDQSRREWGQSDQYRWLDGVTYSLPSASSPVTVTPTTATLSITGYAPTIRLPKVVTPTTRSLTITTYAPTVLLPKTVTPTTASLTTTGYAPTVATPRVVTPATKALTTTGYAPTVKTPRTVTPTAAGLTLTTFAPAVRLGVKATPGTASLNTTGYAPTVRTPRTATPAARALSLTGYAPNVVVPGQVIPSPATLNLTGYPPVVRTPRTVTPGPGSLATTRYAPTVRTPRTVTPGTRSLVLTGFAPTVTVGGSTPTPERVDTGFWGVVDQAASWGVVNDSGGWDVVDETARWKP